MDRLFGLGAFALAVALSSPALAQQEVSPQARAEARERFERGLELYEEGQFRAALAELEQAYEVAPAYQVLYNLGKVYAQLGDAVRATDAFDQYLREGGADIPDERRAEVEQDLERQRARIARVMVRTNVDGSTVMVDGADVATTPLDEPLRVTAGEHVIGARAPRHDAATRRIQLAGGVLESVELELHEVTEERGAIRVRSDVPGVRVLVDGEVAGTTPLDGTLSVPPGRHVVEGRRAGYESARETVDVENAAEAVVRLDMRTDPEARPDELGRLRLRVPDAAFVLWVDDREMDAPGGSVELPVGAHDVLLEVADREPVRETIEVPASGAVELDPELEWTADARQERVDEASLLRTLGWSFGLGGVVLAGLGAPLFFHGHAEYRQSDDDYAALREEFMTCTGEYDACVAMYQGRLDELNDDRSFWLWVRNFAGGAALLGGAALVAGAVLLAIAPSDESIDRAARAGAEPRLRLGVGPGSVSLSGAF